MFREKIDNSGRGNCMYYAYGISLMCFLLKAKNPAVTDKVFNRLALTDLQKEKLNALLNAPEQTQFTKTQITNIIEPILGPVTRKIASEQTAQQFLSNPKDSSLYSATNYGMVYLFHKTMDKLEPNSPLLKESLFNNSNYTNAEIYRLFPATEESGLGRFIASEYKNILDQCNERWPGRFEQIAEQNSQKTREEIDADPFYREQLINEIIGDKTIEFFTKNNNENLLHYVNHLNTNYRWGSEETLLLLHRYVQGERQVRVSPEHSVFEYDTEISMGIYYNGQPTSNFSQDPDMRLNNQENVHWYSFLPKITSPRFVKEKPSNKLTRFVNKTLNSDQNKATPTLQAASAKEDAMTDRAEIQLEELNAVKLHKKLVEKYKIWYQDQLPTVEVVDTVLKIYPVYKHLNAKQNIITNQIRPYLDIIRQAIRESGIEKYNNEHTDFAKQYKSYELSFYKNFIFLGWRIQLQGATPQSKGSYGGTEIFTRLTNMSHDEILPTSLRESITLLLQNIPLEMWIEYETLDLMQSQLGSILHNIHGYSLDLSVSKGTYLEDYAKIEEILIPDYRKLPSNHVVSKIETLKGSDYSRGSIIKLLAFINDLPKPLTIQPEKLFDLMSFIKIESEDRDCEIDIRVYEYKTFMRLLLSAMKDLIISTDNLPKEGKCKLRAFIASVVCSSGSKLLEFSGDERADVFLKNLVKHVLEETNETCYFDEIVYKYWDDAQVRRLLVQLYENQDVLAQRLNEIRPPVQENVSNQYELRIKMVKARIMPSSISSIKIPKNTVINLVGKQTDTSLNHLYKRIPVKRGGTVAEHFAYSIFIAETLLTQDKTVNEAADTFLWCMDQCILTGFMIEHSSAPILSAETAEELCDAMKGYTLIESDFKTSANEFNVDEVLNPIPTSTNQESDSVAPTSTSTPTPTPVPAPTSVVSQLANLGTILVGFFGKGFSNSANTNLVSKVNELEQFPPPI